MFSTPLLRVVIDQVATCVKIERRGGGEFGTMHASGAKPHGDPAPHRAYRRDATRRSGLRANRDREPRYETGKLAELRPPASRHPDAGAFLAECGSTPHAGLHAHHTGFFKVQAHVGPSRLSAQANAPFAGTLPATKERSAFTSEKGSFSAPFLKLIRELVASR